MPRSPPVNARVTALAVVLAVAGVAGCSGGDKKDSAFCRDAGESAARMDNAYSTLQEAGQGAARVDLEEARAAYVTSTQALIEALAQPPEEIKGDAASVAEGLRQQVAGAGELQPGAPPPAFPVERQTAASRVDEYLRATCEVQASVAPR